MSLAIVLLFTAIVCIAYASGRRSDPDAKRSSAGWYGLGLVVALFVGLWISGQAGNESAAYGFGMALVFVVFILLLVAAASAVGLVLRKRQSPWP